MSERKERLHVLNDTIVKVGKVGNGIYNIMKEHGDTQTSAALKTGVSQPKIAFFKDREKLEPDIIASFMIAYNRSFWELFPIEEVKEYPKHIEGREEYKQYGTPHAEKIARFQMMLVDIQKKIRETIPVEHLEDYEMISEEKDGELIFRFKKNR